MSDRTTPTTLMYRNLIAQAAATGHPLPAIAFIALGGSDAPYSPDTDIALGDEFYRLEASTTVSGCVLTVRANLGGRQLPDRAFTEIGVFTTDNTLAGRRVVKPIELESFSEIDIEVTFEF
jgi:hypothetical protein